MGESKRRGTKEERIQQSQHLKKQKLDEIKQKIGVPQEAEFCGYIIHLVEQNAFVQAIEETPTAVNRSSTADVSAGLRFSHFWDAYKYAREEKGEKVVGLFKLGDEFMVRSVL
jgi:hypothetical protein